MRRTLDSFTDDVRQVSVEVDEARHALSAAVERARQEVERLRAEVPPLTEEEVEAFRTACTTGAAAPAWQDVTRRIEHGELTWRDIAEGGMSGDPVIAAAMNQATRLARAAHAAERAAEPARGQAADEEYFENFSAYRESW